MNKIIAFIAVMISWILLPFIIAGLILFLSIGIFWAGSQVLYAYILSELNQRKNNDY